MVNRRMAVGGMLIHFTLNYYKNLINGTPKTNPSARPGIKRNTRRLQLIIGITVNNNYLCSIILYSIRFKTDQLANICGRKFV